MAPGSNGADIKIISTHSRSPEAFKLFGQDDSIKSPEDLSGKKVAGPTAYNMEKDGFPIITDGEGLTEATIVVATSGEYAQSNPEEEKTFLEAQKAVLDYIDTNEEAAMEATAKETR